MTTLELDMSSRGIHPKAVLRRVSGPVATARRGAATVVARVPQAVRAARSGVQASASAVVARVPQAVRAARSGVQAGAETVVGHAPQAAGAARAGVHGTAVALQQLPDSTLRSLAASSIGLGAGLYLSGRRRLAIAASVVPALLAGVAITRPPVEPVVPAKQTS